MLRKPFSQWLALLLSVLLIGSAIAATERFEYDPLGRLTRMVDGANKVTDYRYDAAGNLLEVGVGAVAAPPVISSVSPQFLRRGETRAVTITGSGFLGITVAPADPALDLSALQVSATQISFNLSASNDAPLGAQPIGISSVGGSATASITVAPLLPKVNVDPAPLAIPPDNVSRVFTIRLSNADVLDHTIALSATNTNIQVSPGSVTIPAGQLSVSANIRGVAGGQSTITLSSVTLGTTLVPVFITAEFVGITTSIAPILGVMLEGGTPQNPALSVPMTSSALGVLVGSAISNIAPDSVHIGTGPTVLTIKGIGLEGAQSVSIEPDTGLTLGAPAVSTDGFSVALPLTVAAGAPVGPRRVIVKNSANAAFPAFTPTADRLNIVRAEPHITSIDPLFGTPDTTFSLTVRGRNLQGASALVFNPSTGIATDASPIVNADGTAFTARVTLGINAALGDHIVSVTTTNGTSTTGAEISNTFKVVNEIRGAISPVIAPLVGLVLQDASTPPSPPVSLTSQAVGIAFGAVATKLSPVVGIVGQTMNLIVEGADLSGATAVSLLPDTGLTVGEPGIASDGKSISLPLTIAIDAPQTLRKVKVMAGTIEIPFASAYAAGFQVSLPLPEVDSITPIVLQTGQAPIAMIVRGRNFQNASAVRISPSTNMTISASPVVNSAGTEVAVDVSAGANAVANQRLVTVVTPAGESSTTMVPANTLFLSSSAGAIYSPITAALVGVVKLDDGEVPATPVGPIVAPAVGVVLQADAPDPISTTTSQFAKSVGVAFGAAATSVDVNGFAPGFSGTLVVRGHELSGVTSAIAAPVDGVTLGTHSVSSDGKQLSLPIAVDADAARGPRTLKLITASGNVEFADPFAAQLRVGPGVPRFESISPILAKQGDLVTMTIRGANFHDATEIVATPGSGFNFVPGTLVVNATGTELSVKFVLDADTSLGSRVIQMLVPGASNDATPAAANTFTVFAP